MDPIDNHRERATTVLGWTREWGPGLVVGATLATVATVAGFISYTHICALTLALHQSWKTAHLQAIAVDGQLLIGSAVLATVGGGQKWWGLLGVVPGLAESLFANWESGIAHGITAAIWATVAAQAFAVSSFLFERWLKWRVTTGGHAKDARPATTDEALRALLATTSRRSLAAVLGIEAGQVQKWERHLAAVAAEQAPEPALNGAGPGA